MQKAHSTLPEDNPIRIMIDKLINTNNSEAEFELIGKLKRDLMEPGRVYEAIVILLIELFKKKVTFDLFGKDYTKQ